MKFFLIDLHISTAADVKRIFTDLGHEVTDLCLSGHHWVMNRKQDYVAELSNDKWTRLVWDWNFDSFYKAHKDSLKGYDAFIVNYPPIFAMLYEKFDKPIIVNMPIRYDYGVHGCPKRLGKWNSWLTENVKNGRVKLVANNKYDVEYCRILSGLAPKHIPALCEYFPKRDDRKRKNFVLYELGNSFEKHGLPIADRSHGLPNGWKWRDIHQYEAVVHLPYQVSTMSIFEHYTANIPMLFPSKKFLADMYFVGKWNVLSQVSNYRMSNKKLTKTVIPINGSLDPNNWKSREVVENLWLKNADFYDEEWMRHLIYFNSIDELKFYCNATNYDHYSELMKKSNKFRKINIYALWKEILDEVKR